MYFAFFDNSFADIFCYFMTVYQKFGLIREKNDRLTQNFHYIKKIHKLFNKNDLTKA